MANTNYKVGSKVIGARGAVKGITGTVVAVKGFANNPDLQVR